MSNKYFDGVVKSTGVKEDVDADLKAVVTGTFQRATEKNGQAARSRCNI